jgi:hypothetical protein
MLQKKYHVVIRKYYDEKDLNPLVEPVNLQWDGKLISYTYNIKVDRDLWDLVALATIWYDDGEPIAVEINSNRTAANVGDKFEDVLNRVGWYAFPDLTMQDGFGSKEKAKTAMRLWIKETAHANAQVEVYERLREDME